MNRETRIWTTVDYSADGKHIDYLRLPHSTDLSAYGWVPIPIVCIKNGKGPTALLIAGNHGDEYEGQIALMNLAREIDTDDVRGRVIILSALNFPAVMAGRRVSPLDEGNLNRSFPGDPYGSPTEMIAHYVSDVLLPMVDVVVDLHSGGRSLEHIPCALIRPGRDSAEHNILIDMMNVFGAPISFVSNGEGGGGLTTLSAAAQQRNAPTLTAELGSGATLSKEGLELAEKGVRRLLKHFEITPGANVETPGPTRLMEARGHNHLVYASVGGIFEPRAELGDSVVAGQLAGRIYFPDSPTLEPETIFFEVDGLVAGRRFPSLTTRGDCLFNLMKDLN